MIEKELPKTLVIPTKKGTLDAFSFNEAHEESIFSLSQSPDPTSKGKEIRGADINLIFLIGLFSLCFFLSDEEDLLQFEISVNELKRFLGLSSGGNGFKVHEAVDELSSLYGIVGEDSVRVIENLKHEGSIIRFESLYFRALMRYLRRVEDGEDKRHPFFTNLVQAEIAKARNKPAAEVVLVLASIIARRGSALGGKAHISLKTLLLSCPSFADKFNRVSGSKKNEVLKGVLNKAMEYIPDYTGFSKKYGEVIIELPSITNRKKLNEKIEIKIGGKKNGRKK